MADVAWVPLADAPSLLAYRGERRLVTALLAEA